MLEIKSEELAKRLRHNKFKAKDGCIDGNANFGIKFKKAHGEKDVDAVKC
jgi:hypothetical protein